MKQHVDNLAHDSSTRCLHLEHINCNKCGQNDVHGVFQCVSQQRWQDGAATDGGVVQVHFFEITVHGNKHSLSSRGTVAQRGHGTKATRLLPDIVMAY